MTAPDTVPTANAPIVDKTMGAFADDWMARQLPGVLAADPFVQRFLRIFQDVADTVRWPADHLEQYVRVAEAPPEVMRWLGKWLNLEVDQTWNEERQRSFIAEAGPLFRFRGTASGLKRFLQIATGFEDIQIEESGGVHVHRDPTPDAMAPGVDPTNDGVSVRGTVTVIIPVEVLNEARYRTSKSSRRYTYDELKTLIQELIPADILLDFPDPRVQATPADTPGPSEVNESEPS